MNRCEECRFWDTSVSAAGDDNDSTGMCRVNPPVADKRNHLAVWPFTEASDGCARWQVIIVEHFEDRWEKFSQEELKGLFNVFSVAEDELGGFDQVTLQMFSEVRERYKK